MYFLFSGEGPTDLGVGAVADSCEGDRFLVGPMAMVVDRIVETRLRYSLLESTHFGYVSEAGLAEACSDLKAQRKSPMLPGVKRAKETLYFHRNARALARIAIQKEKDLGDDVTAILFHDSDGTASAERGEWARKFQSMVDGFEQEQFLRGVPMVPKPKSEAWLICAVRSPPYSRCNDLEDRSGNDGSPNSLKKELEKLLGRVPDRETLAELVRDRCVDVDRIDMPSFQAFREKLENAVGVRPRGL